MVLESKISIDFWFIARQEAENREPVADVDKDLPELLRRVLCLATKFMGRSVLQKARDEPKPCKSDELLRGATIAYPPWMYTVTGNLETEVKEEGEAMFTNKLQQGVINYWPRIST